MIIKLKRNEQKRKRDSEVFNNLIHKIKKKDSNNLIYVFSCFLFFFGLATLPILKPFAAVLLPAQRVIVFFDCEFFAILFFFFILFLFSAVYIFVLPLFVLSKNMQIENKIFFL